MKLYLNNTEHEVKFKPFISPKMKGEAVDLLGELSEIDPKLKMQKRLFDIAQDLYGENIEGLSYAELISSGKLSKEQMKELTELAMNADKFSPETEKLKDKYTIKLFKLLIDEKQLPTDYKEVFNDDDFWYEQDLIEMEKEVDSFRGKIKCEGK